MGPQIGHPEYARTRSRVTGRACSNTPNFSFLPNFTRSPRNCLPGLPTAAGEQQAEEAIVGAESRTGMGSRRQHQADQPNRLRVDGLPIQGCRQEPEQHPDVADGFGSRVRDSNAAADARGAQRLATEDFPDDLLDLVRQDAARRGHFADEEPPNRLARRYRPPRSQRRPARRLRDAWTVRISNWSNRQSPRCF